MKNMSFILASDHITIVFDDGFSGTVYNTDPKYDTVIAAVKANDADTARTLCEPAKMIVETFNKPENEGLVDGQVEIIDGEVLFDGEPLHNSLTTRMLGMIEAGFNVDPLIAFLKNVMQNPSYRAVNELYTFLEKSDLPITEDGHFLAYKRVRLDFMDEWSGTIDNSVGQIVHMRRNLVDEDASRTCSNGLHFCSREYLPNYGSASGGQIVMVKINPADVVAIPEDYNNAKGRTCRYEVVSVLTLDPDSVSSTRMPEEELEGPYQETPELEREALDYDNAVVQMDPETFERLRVFSDAREAADIMGLDASNIRRVMRGYRKTTGGYAWKSVTTYNAIIAENDEDKIELADPPFDADDAARDIGDLVETLKEDDLADVSLFMRRFDN